MVSLGAVVESSREMPRFEAEDGLEAQINAEKADIAKAWPGLVDLLEDWPEERRAEIKKHEDEITELAAIKTQISGPETRFENLVSEVNNWIIDEQTPDLVVDREKAALASLLAYPGIAESGDAKAKLEARYNVQRENLGDPRAKEYVFGDILRRKRAERKARQEAIAVLSNESATLEEVKQIKETLFNDKEEEAPANLPVENEIVEPKPIAVQPKVRRARMVRKKPKSLEEQIAAIDPSAMAEVPAMPENIMAISPDEFEGATKPESEPVVEEEAPAPVATEAPKEMPQPEVKAAKPKPSRERGGPSLSSVEPRKGIFERISGWWNELFKTQ